MMDISIVIPCYNEIDNVIKIKQELVPIISDLAESSLIEVVFVNDGCTDGTMESLKEHLVNIGTNRLSIKYADNFGNRGLGKAIRTGFENSTGKIIVTTDSDGTYKFQHIKDLLEYLTPDVDIVTASPYHPKGGVIGVQKYRLVLSQGSSLIYRILVDWRVHTYTCLFRAYRRHVIEEIPFISNGFLSGTELLVKSMLKGFRVVEYPAVLYRRTYGTSKARIARTILDHLRFQWSVLLHRLGLTNLVLRKKQKKVRSFLKTKYSI